MINFFEVGERVRKIRLDLVLTRTEFGAVMSETNKPIAETTVANWEEGGTLINIKRAEKLRELSGVSLDYLYLGKEASTETPESFTTHKFIEHCEELGYLVENHETSISVYVPGKAGIKYLIAWVNKQEVHNYRLYSVLHPNKELLSDVVHAYSKTTKGKRGNKHKLIGTYQQDISYNIK